MQNSIFLQAFEGTNKTVPVWFMRQAGRYLPEYRKLRQRHSLQEMFVTPEIASRVTLMPVRTIGVDAAILFADILTLPAAMGFEVSFPEGSGPVIGNRIEKSADLKRVRDFEELPHLRKTIAATIKELPSSIPLIGFAGAPFTVACYLLCDDPADKLQNVLRFAYQCPEDFKRLLEKLSENTIRYLNLQKQAGVKAFQLFDTWAGALRPADFGHWALPYVQKIFKKVELPSIYYVKNSAPVIRLMEQSGADVLSVCHSVVLGHESVLGSNRTGIQGNLFNGLLYADLPTLKREVNDVLLGARHYRRYIFNLSHGVFPDTDPDKLKRIVEWVHSFAWKTI